MPGFNPDKLNIHDLTIEEPEDKSGLPFDRERDLTKADFNRMKEYLQQYAEEGNWQEYASQAMRIKEIDSTYNLGIDNETWQEMERSLESKRDLNDWLGFAQQAAAMKIIGFDSNFGKKITKADLGAINRFLQRREKKREWSQFCFTAADMKIIDSSFDISDDQESIDGINEKIKACAMIGSWEPFSRHAASLKILCPDADIPVNGESWKGMRETLERYRGTYYEFLVAPLAFNMKILAAREVKTTDKGIDIIMPIDSKPETKQMPEQRNF